MPTNIQDPPVPVMMNEPVGDVPCTGLPEAPCPPSTCGAQFQLDESTGASSLLSYGGPFPLPLPSTDASCNTPCGSPCGPSFIFPGTNLIGGPICLPLTAPGTFKVFFRADLVNVFPVQRIVAVWYPDCANPDPASATVIVDKQIPLGCVDLTCVASALQLNTVMGPRNFEVDGEISVFSPNCNPGVQVLFDSGCAGGCVETVIASVPVASFIQNIQFQVLRLAGRDLVNAAGSPLITGVPGFVHFSVSFVPPPAPGNPFTLVFNKPTSSVGITGTPPTNVTLTVASTGAPVAIVSGTTVDDLNFVYTTAALTTGVTYLVTLNGAVSLCPGDPPIVTSFTFVAP